MLPVLAHLQVGLIGSWSGYNTYKARNPDAPDPLIAFKAGIQEALHILDADDPEAVNLEWSLFVILAKDPVPLPAA